MGDAASRGKASRQGLHEGLAHARAVAQPPPRGGRPGGSWERVSQLFEQETGQVTLTEDLVSVAQRASSVLIPPRPEGARPALRPGVVSGEDCAGVAAGPRKRRERVRQLGAGHVSGSPQPQQPLPRKPSVQTPPALLWRLRVLPPG